MFKKIEHEERRGERERGREEDREIWGVKMQEVGVLAGWGGEWLRRRRRRKQKETKERKGRNESEEEGERRKQEGRRECG